MNEPLAKHRIIIEADDNDLIKPCEKFIRDLENEYSNFEKELEKNTKKWNKVGYLNHKNIIFTPEDISIKSPLTIIDAPWGSGKTFFIESLAKHIIQGKIKLEKFEKIIIIDVWKYSNYKNIPNDIMLELFSILASKMENKFLDGLKNLFNMTLIPLANKLSGFDLDKIPNEQSIEVIVKKLDKMPKTIIIFDNLERVGNGSWDILKAIQKLSNVSNFLFILPMNKNKMIDPFIKDSISNFNEHTIEKYLSLPFFSFEQNYLGILRSMDFDEYISYVINNFLEIPNKNSEVLTARQAKKRIEDNNLKEIFDRKGKYSLLRNFLKVWEVNQNVIEYIKNEISDFVKILKEINNHLVQIQGQIKKINLIIKYYDINHNYHSMETIIKNLSLNLKSLLDDRENEFKYIINIIKETENLILEKLKEKNSELKIKNKIKKLELKILENKATNKEQILFNLKKREKEIYNEIQEIHLTNMDFRQCLINEKDKQTFRDRRPGLWNNTFGFNTFNRMSNNVSTNNTPLYNDEIIETNKYFKLILDDKKIIQKDQNSIFWNINKLSEKKESLLNSKENIEIWELIKELFDQNIFTTIDSLESNSLLFLEKLLEIK